MKTLRGPFAYLLFCVALSFATLACAKSNTDIAAAALPLEARQTLELVKQGGPFSKDGSVFGNFEKRLPLRWRGYYREYTVRTPGVSHRGARRIVAGSGPNRDVRTSGEYYYTDNHYDSFRRIRE